MNREEIEAGLLDFALNEGTESKRDEIARAVAASPELQEELRRLREAVGMIAAAADTPGERLSQERRERVLAAVKPRPRAGWVRPLSLAAAGILVIACAALFVDQGGERRQPMITGESSGEQPETLTKAARLLRATGSAVQTYVTRYQDPANVWAEQHDGQLMLNGWIDHRATQNSLLYGFSGNYDSIFSNEQYGSIIDNGFLRATDQPLSTFSIDVDTASYANVRRYLNAGQLPPADAVRIEEMINYFRYDYPEPDGPDPFSVNLETHAAPWAPAHRLVRIGLRGREIKMASRPASNLVFLIDVSGSMNSPDKLPLVKEGLRLLVQSLDERDRVALAVYAGNAGLVLPSTPGTDKEKILAAIDRLEAGGSTNGGAGIQLAYNTAVESFAKGGVNRVLLCTDGDFNVGIASAGDLVRLIEEQRKSGVFLSVLGFGTGNYADARMQELADKGNGNAFYIDSVKEARKVLVEEASGTLITIAKDVKIQVEFNPAKVAAYRLVGYENRMLAAQDFNDDKKDAGEIGAGHRVTALYEIVPAGVEIPGSKVDPLKYQQPPAPAANRAATDELLTVKLRYKQPEGTESAKLEIPMRDAGDGVEPSADFDFAAAVASFGMLLRDSEHKGQASWDLAVELAAAGVGADPGGHRAEFLELARKAKALAQR